MTLWSQGSIYGASEGPNLFKFVIVANLIKPQGVFVEILSKQSNLIMLPLFVSIVIYMFINVLFKYELWL